MGQIQTSLYLIEKVGYSSYSYPCLVNAEIPGQNRNEFGQYSRGQIYLSSYIEPANLININKIGIILKKIKSDF